MEIVNYPHPALRWKSQPVQTIDSKLRSTIREMFGLMYERKGIGLAANQVALPYRLFIINLSKDPGNSEEELVFINPEITHRRGIQEVEEGCLSLPGLYGPVARFGKATIKAFDLDGKELTINADNFLSCTIQHEFDHISGVLFTDRMSKFNKCKITPMLSDFEDLFKKQQNNGEYPSNTQIRLQLEELQP